jgi:hypothetical protein
LFAVNPPSTDCPSDTSSRPVPVKAFSNLQPSLSRTKLCRIMLALTLTTAESGLTLSGRWKTLYLFLKILKAHSTKLCALHRRYFYTLFFFILFRYTKTSKSISV